MNQPGQDPIDSSRKPSKITSILQVLVILSTLNWIVFFGVSLHLGGDAVGTLPSKDGFVVKSHGNTRPVSEQAWVASLYYSGATLLSFPAIWIAYAARAYGQKFKQAPILIKIFICIFISIWGFGWYGSIGASVLRSIEDYQRLKDSSRTLQKAALRSIERTGAEYIAVSLPTFSPDTVHRDSRP